MGGSVSDILKPVINQIVNSTGINGWNAFRDSAETAGSLGADYLAPGSSLLTNGLVSKGAQNTLSSPLFQAGQLAAGAAGAGVGSGVTGIPSSNLGSLLSGAGQSLGISGPGTTIGTTAGTPLADGVGPTAGSGVLGSASRGISDVGSTLSKALSTGTGGGASSYLPTIVGGATSLIANNSAKNDLLDAQNKALGQLQPYTESGAAANKSLADLLGTSGNTGAAGYGSLTKPFTPGDLTQDPGYQFDLTQGNQALDRQQAAKGNYFSGSALKAAQDYGTGLADNTYNAAYQRNLTGNQQIYNDLAGQGNVGASAAGAAGTILENSGNAQANSTISANNTFNSTLSSLLNGTGAKKPTLVNGQIVYQ